MFEEIDYSLQLDKSVLSNRSIGNSGCFITDTATMSLKMTHFQFHRLRSLKRCSVYKFAKSIDLDIGLLFGSYVRLRVVLCAFIYFSDLYLGYVFRVCILERPVRGSVFA